MSNHEKHFGSAADLLRCAADFGRMAVASAFNKALSAVDQAMEIDFEPRERMYPTEFEAPAATEEELA